MTKVNVLGTNYDICTSEEDDPKMDGASGYCEFYSKKIVLANIKPSTQSFESLDEYKKRVLRHEIIHAFFAESGLRSNCDFAENEELVDWIAIQFYKLDKAFRECGCAESEE